MLINRWIVAAAIGFAAFQTQNTFAAGSGHGHSGNHSQSNNHNQSQSALPAFANSWPYLRAENGIFGPLWAAPGPGSLSGLGNGGGFCNGGGGWGGGGWGGGWGWGGGAADYEYYIGRRPYFSVYSPVYYDYVDGAIVPKTPMPFSMANAAYQPSGSQPMVNQQAAGAPQAANSASETRPAPLMIANPYYKAEK